MTLNFDRIADFIYANPTGFSHLVDLPYRLSAWSFDDPDNLHIWEANGQIQAVAMLQMPWVTLDYAYLSGDETLASAVFEWAVARAQAIADDTGDDFTLCIRIPAQRAAHIPLVESSGFQLDDEWTIVHLSRELNTPLPVPELPDGFGFRALRGQSEVEAYVNLHQISFGSKAMRVGWRSRSLTMSQYRPELDLFIVNTDDQPVAFCIGWMHPHEPVGQIEPLGVHPDYQRLGLGRAVLLEGVRRLQAEGAATASIDTYKYNDPALALYQSPNHGNFQPSGEAVGYIRTFMPGQRKAT
jgi:ribosomal protein S18 acetylase RimI-like enzyme